MKVINVINAKGGVGKTTASLNVAVGLASKGYRILLVDADPQGNATSSILDDNMEYEKKKDVNGVLLNLFSIEECIYPTAYHGMDILPSFDMELITTDKEIFSKVARESKLAKQLRKVRKAYDYVIIDNAPTFNTVTINTLNCGDEVIIPMVDTKLAYFGLKMTIGQLMELSDPEMLDRTFNIHIFMNMIHRGVRPKTEKFINDLKNEYKGLMLNTSIGYQDSKVKESEERKKILYFAKSKSNKVAEDYRKLINEIEGIL